MAIWMISGTLGFAAGFALCWFWKSKVQAAVVATNAAVVDVKSVVSTVASDVKKI